MKDQSNNSARSSNSKQHNAAIMFDSESFSVALDHAVQDSQSDAFDPASVSSEKSSTPFYDRSRGPGRPRKRKTTATSTSSQPRLKHLKGSYNDDYRGLFNSTVKEIASNTSSEVGNVLQGCRIGVTVWSPEEKAAFFRALTRRGRQDIRGIATDIGSKSESEVYIYSDLLYKASKEQQTYETRKHSLDTSKLEAALEVRDDCCAALDLAAEALSALQQNEEERAEKERHKDLALLNPRIARWVECCMIAPEGGKEEVLQQIPAARMLNLVNFLALSKRLFMNSVLAEDNWRSYTSRETKSPSIMYTAFSDFHALSISITQRLVQSSLFFAMSRLRAVSVTGNYTPRSHVRRRDVMTALNVLGMRTDAKAFWARTARKCKLRVYDRVRHRQVFGKKYSYLEVERILSPSMICDPDSSEITHEDASTSTSRGSRSMTESSASEREDSPSSDLMSIEAYESRTLPNDDYLSASPLDPIDTRVHKQRGHDQSQDAYVEAVDLHASRNEERRLWEMLGQDPTKKLEPVDVKLPLGPFPKRKDKEPLSDWRDWVDYAGDWETHETPLLGSSFANNRGFRNDVDSAAGLTGSESNSESLVNDSTEEEDESDSDEDADGDGTTNDDGAYTSSADDAEDWAGNNGGNPGGDIRRPSREDDTPAVRRRRGGLRPGDDGIRHKSSHAR